MAWTAPRTWVAGEIVTAALMNAHVRDNTRYLKGLDGVPTIESGLTIDNTDGDERLLLPLLSTAECATVLNAAGEVAYDEATNRIKMYGAALNSVVTTADVDDTPVNGATTDPVSSNWAYDFQQALTTAGDLTFATAAGVWDRLAIGTAGQVLKTNAGTTAPEWTSIAFTISSGSYSGDDSANKAIAHGLGSKPKIVFIMLQGSPYSDFKIFSDSLLYHYPGAAANSNSAYAVTVMDTTNFYVGNAAEYDFSANATGETYSWIALG